MNYYFVLTTLIYLILTTNTLAKLLVSSPDQLVKEINNLYPSGIPYSVANYGDVPFGSTLSGNVYIPTILQNCNKHDLSDPDADLHINKIVMSKRGDCSFTTKSLNSQKQGAKMALISDNITTQNPERIVLVDDGRGPQVKIPTVFIPEQLGQLIQKYSLKGQKVNVAFRFNTNQKQIANVSIWISSFQRKSYILVRHLEAYFSRIKQYINLQVHHPTYQCHYCLQSDCYYNNKYCINTGIQGYFTQFLGRNIIRQQIRQEIILQKYPDLWWKFMENYDDACDINKFNQDCAIKAMIKTNIDSKEIDDAVNQTFMTVQIDNPDGNGTVQVLDNKLLQKNNQIKLKSGIFVIPAIVVNNITYRGNLEGLDIFEMVCNSLIDQPQGCFFDVKQPTAPWKIIIIVIVCSLVFIIFLVGCYRRKVRRQLSKDINKDVNNLVNQYITMYQAQKFENKDKQ